MTRIAGTLYFAPGVSFEDVDLTGMALPKQVFERIYGFYLEPAAKLADENDAFAAGLLAVCAVDALGLLMTESNEPTERIVGIVRKIPDLSVEADARRFCDHFRNGLVHEARIKKSSEFSLDIDRVAIHDHDRLRVNPQLFVKAVEGILVEFRKRLVSDLGELNSLRMRIRRRFDHELNN